MRFLCPVTYRMFKYGYIPLTFEGMGCAEPLRLLQSSGASKDTWGCDLTCPAQVHHGGQLRNHDLAQVNTHARLQHYVRVQTQDNHPNKNDTVKTQAALLHPYSSALPYSMLSAIIANVLHICVLSCWCLTWNKIFLGPLSTQHQ